MDASPVAATRGFSRQALGTQASAVIWTWVVYDMWNLPGPGIEPVLCTGRQILICYTTREVLKVSFFFLNFCFNQAEPCLKRITKR